MASAARTKARAWFEAKLAKEPESSALAADLADLLLIDARWTVLEPAEMKAQGGATLTRLEDNSILVSGPNPAQDVYTLTFRNPPPRIQQLRLDVLPHPSLPNNGPGRNENGNFVLTTIKAQLHPPTNKSVARSLKLARAFADFSQQAHLGNRLSFDVSLAIDQDPSTGWAIFPETGKPHFALFALAEPISETGSTVLRVTLEFKSRYKQHGLGRFRLSVSGEAAAFDREAKRAAVLQLTEPWVKLAAANALNGRHDKATAYFAKALRHAEGRAGKATVIAGAALLPGLLEKLARSAPNDGPFHAELARHYAERGNNPQASAALAKALALFEKQLAREPENYALAAGLAQLLFDNLGPTEPKWVVLKPATMKTESGARLTLQDDGSVLVEAPNTEQQSVRWQPGPQPVRAVRIETSTHASTPGSGVLFFNEYRTFAVSMGASRPGVLRGQFVRLDLPGDNRQFPRHPADRDKKTINLAELQVFHGEQNIALRKKARQSSDWPGGGSRLAAQNAVDGNTAGTDSGNPYAHTASEDNPWWEVDLGSEQPINRIVIWNRIEAGLHARMNHFRVRVLDRSRKVVFEQVVDKAPNPSTEIVPQALLVKSKSGATGENQPLILRLPRSSRKDALPRYRVSVANRLADLGLEEKRLEALKLSDPWLKLAAAYESAGRTREAIPHLAKASAAKPKDTLLSLKVAVLQAWFGQDRELAATRRRILAFARDTNDAGTAEHAARSSSILPSTDKPELKAALALARTAVKLDKGSQWRDWRLMTLGMAEYRSGNDAAADEALRAAAKAGPVNPYVTGISAFYRAMILFRQGKPDEARKLASAAAAKMKPLPADEQNPLAGDAYYDDLVLWLAYKEAKALIKLATPPPRGENDEK